MRIAQISDTHLTLDVASREQDFLRCIAQINALDPLPDVVIHTGDVSHDGSDAQYRLAGSLLGSLKVPWFVIPGNKDDREAMKKAFLHCGIPRDDFEFVQFAIDDFPVRLVCLDTLCTTSNKGAFCNVRLKDLESILAAEPDRQTAIFMHHPPFDVDEIPDPFQFVDRQSANALLESIRRHRQVSRIYCGHVHRKISAQAAGLPAEIMTAVAVDLRKGKLIPVTPETPLFELHELDPSGVEVSG